MAGMEEMLGSIMQNPQAMQQIFSLAQSLGLSQNQSQEAVPPPAQSQAPPPAPSPIQPLPGQPDLDGMFRTILSLASQSGGNDRQIRLFEALKPFLRPERAKQLDQAIQVARISQMAGSALKRLGAGSAHGTGGGNHV